MKNSRKFYTVVWAVCLAVFNIIVFIVPNMNKFGVNFWLGYALITIAFIGNLICALKALNTDNLTKTFYNIPLVTISIIGIVVSTIVGAIFMTVPILPIWLGIVICFVILAFVTIAVITAKSVADTVSDIDDKIKEQTSFIKMITVDAEHLMKTASTPEIKNEAKKVYEAFRYADPMSSTQLLELENQIQQQFNLFTEATTCGDITRITELATELRSLIDYRNKKCKLLK